MPFVLLITCFAAWGSAVNLSEVLVSVFRKIFVMSNFQSALVTFAYYGAYFTLAIPAAFINKRFGYKTGVLTGLGLAAFGGLLFLPASWTLTYGVFLIALFVLAAGLSILETSVWSSGPTWASRHELGGARPQWQKGVLGRLFINGHYRFGVIAQFFNVAAQVCTWSFTIQYAEGVLGFAPRSAGWYLQASLLLFLVSRFLMFYLLGKFKPTRLLLIMAVLGVVFALTGVVTQNIVGLICIVGISLSLSLMFPTIYGVALQGLGEHTKFGAAGLVMAILGGALIPPVQGLVVDAAGGNHAVGYLVPSICLAFVAAYALYDLRSGRGGHVEIGAGGH